MLVELWLAALNVKVGIAIQTDNRATLRQHLYKARAEANNPELDSLEMILPEKEDELWIVRKDAHGSGADHEDHLKLVFP
jgi:hypothetical protein